jgi:hypothetical protein
MDSQATPGAVKLWESPQQSRGVSRMSNGQQCPEDVRAWPEPARISIHRQSALVSSNAHRPFGLTHGAGAHEFRIDHLRSSHTIIR